MLESSCLDYISISQETNVVCPISSCANSKIQLVSSFTGKTCLQEEHVDVVVAYAVAEELNLSQLKDSIHEQGLYTICQLPIGQ